ncbi:GDP-mannose 4,6-dehydratase [Piscinibacter gummiphilus]|uniref:GDP-mannose 4,6-dehydratase n=1 Tax=Piscinibacter gummiphilus TaxID=946333 RepID=A0A1W6LED5_9BURK|nr:GDP-mannose 4,6-dehydratase [Piscinibacter gummiphilus]ARN22634.1 GDP-mannose 4,6-dehydratase [Piscinibacter gummiphilus]
MSATRSPSATTPRRALICGVGGQDGAYLTRLLLDKGYEVFGTSRDVTGMRGAGLSAVGARSRVQLVSMASNDFRSVLQTITRTAPDEVYNLAGQSSVGLSFEQPVETIESIALGTLNLLEAIRFVDKPIRFYNAGSSECFGDTADAAASEETPFRPRSPYAVAKACAHNLVANYRDAYGMHASTGILFNHESPLRPDRFVTQKIVRAACRIAAGGNEALTLGNLDIHRDWGWAPEYVDAMWRMLQQDRAADFVIATGRSVSLEHFVATSFAHFGLDWRQHVRHDPSLLRPSDIRFGAADPSLAERQLGWKARVSVEQVVAEMCRAAQAATSSGG